MAATGSAAASCSRGGRVPLLRLWEFLPLCFSAACIRSRLAALMVEGGGLRVEELVDGGGLRVEELVGLNGNPRILPTTLVYASAGGARDAAAASVAFSDGAETSCWWLP
jgi:hypothetical protein